MKFVTLRHIILLSIYLVVISSFGQIKIGDAIDTIDGTSILELESSDRVFVPTRISTDQMNSLTPLHGALVYNIDTECIFVYDGLDWKSLCSGGTTVTTSMTEPQDNRPGDLWVNQTTSDISVWDGTDFLLIDNNPKKGTGAPSETSVSESLPGDLYVDQNNGALYTFDGTQWILQNQTYTVQNGLTKTADMIEMGGVLTEPTAITTDVQNTLALEGLQVMENSTDRIVTIERATGVLRSMSQTSLVRKQEVVIIAAEGQNQFTTPHTIINPQKIDVYRNGIKINFNAIGTNTIELGSSIVCFQNDEIRIVQFL